MRSLRLPLDQLRTHMYLVGSSGAGKSKYLQHILFEVVTAGMGCGVIDPHSDLANDLVAQLATYPSTRPWLARSSNLGRIVYVDPARSDIVVPVNLLKSSVATPYEIAENVVEAFRRVWPETLSEAPRFAQILRNTVVVLASCGLTLLDIEPFLTRTEYRARILADFPDPQVKSFFSSQYNHWGRNQMIMASPVLNKVSAFLFQPAVRRSLGSKDNRLDLRAIMDEKKVLIVDLGGLTGETQQLYGSLLVTSLESAAKSRRSQPVEQRSPFFCVIDEFPNFVTRDSVTLARILSEIRKFSCFIGLSHQTISQTDNRMQGALENAQLRLVLKSGRLSAEALAPTLYLPKTDAIKHLVPDADYQDRSHPLFESLVNQVEQAVQRIMRLKMRRVLIKLPNRDGVLEATTPTVPPCRLSRVQVEKIKRRLALQTGNPTSDDNGAANEWNFEPEPSRNRENAESPDWTSALWHAQTSGTLGKGQAGDPKFDA